MDRSVVLAAAALMLLFASTGSSAASRTEIRESNQQARIVQGVQSGALTTAEAARLTRGQQRVDAAQRRARADGAVTAHERAVLAHQQHWQSVRIARQKHDLQRRIR